jgi:hypothetical protein
MDQSDRPTNLHTVSGAWPPFAPISGDTCRFGSCDRVRRQITRRVQVAACGACGTVEWFRDGTPIPAFDGVAEVFGAFDLVGTLPAINAPGPEVLLYAAPNPACRRVLETLPPRVWLYTAPGLAMSHDRRHLLVSPATQVSDRLTPA